MKFRASILSALFVLVLSGALIAADEAKPQQAPETKKDAPKAKVPAPYKNISSLTDEQKQKLADIHKKSLEEIAKIKDKEEADCTALLNDDQKKELKDIQAKAEAEKKEKSGKKNKDDHADHDHNDAKPAQ